LILCSGVASSASREESEEMYSGVSSVPMIFSGSRSRLEENEKEVKHEITHESKKQVKRKTHSRTVRFFGALSSLGCLPLSMALGFSLLEQG
jgi:mannose/fructose-specific phosphotransferase system component IIA